MTSELRRKCAKKVAKELNISLSTVLKVIIDDSFTDTTVYSTPKKLSKPSPKKIGCIQRSKMKLFDYQARVVEVMMKPTQRGLIVVHSVGSGKTLTANAVAECFLDAHPTRRVVVITPKSLVDNFKKENIAAYGGKNLDKYIFYTHNKFGKDAKAGTLPKDLIPGNLVIIDEIHNYRTKVTNICLQHYLATKEVGKLELSYFVNEALKPAAKVLGLTATPLVNEIYDLKMLMSLVTGKDLYRTIKGKRTMEMLLEEGKGLFSFYERAKHDPRFPSYTVHKIEIVMPEDYFEKYMEIEEHLTKEVAEMGEAFFYHIRHASNKIDDSMHSPKVTWTIQKIQELVDNGGKVVVYSSFINSGIKMIEGRLDALGIGSALITGEVSKNERNVVVKDYNSRKKPVLLITKAGGEGLDLKGTTAVIMLEQTWNGASRTQVFGRGVRSGSHTDLPKDLQHVDCYILLMVKPKPPAGISATSQGKYARISGDKRIYTFIETKERYTHQILSALDPISIDEGTTNRWIPDREEYYILPEKRTPVKGNYELDMVRIDEMLKRMMVDKDENSPKEAPKKGGKKGKGKGSKKSKKSTTNSGEKMPDLPFYYPKNRDNEMFKRGMGYVRDYLENDPMPRLTVPLSSSIEKLIVATNNNKPAFIELQLDVLVDEVDKLRIDEDMTNIGVVSSSCGDGVCIFVNNGTKYNDAALRQYLAKRKHLKLDEVVVVRR